MGQQVKHGKQMCEQRQLVMIQGAHARVAWGAKNTCAWATETVGKQQNWVNRSQKKKKKKKNVGVTARDG